MDKRKLGGSDLMVSELCLGTMQFGWTADEAASFALMDAFAEAGGNFIDTADIYTNWGPRGMAGGGCSEEIIGRWIQARGNRNKIFIATKVRGKMAEGPDGEGLKRERVICCCEDSLRRLQVDCIDLYQLHWADLNTPIEETLAALDQLVRAGKVRHVGASNYPAWRLLEALWRSDQHGYPRLVSYQPEYSLMERALFEMEAMPLCRHYQLGVIPYSPLAAGFLTGKYHRGAAVGSVRADWVGKRYLTDAGYQTLDTLETIGRAHGKTVSQTALAWLLTNPVMTAPIVGANSVAQLLESLGAVGYRLARDEIARLNAATAYSRNWRPIWD
jgi:aryl-alcohol dehydrogenase-like predicted oxidoreductase